MTVSTTDSVVEYVSGGPAFPIPYRFLKDSDIEAVLVRQDGISETLVQGTQYTLTGAGAQSGGTLTSAYAAGFLATPGAVLTISRIMDAVQPTDLRNQGRFLAETHETVFDRLTMLIQQGFAGISRALKRPVGKSYFDAEGRRIANVADPTQMQDAATMGWASRFIADLIGSIQGPINNALNIFYKYPDGTTHVVQDLAGANGAYGIGVGETSLGDVIPFYLSSAGLPSGGDDKLALQALLDSLSAAGGARVVFDKPSPYLTSDAVHVGSNMTLEWEEGAGFLTLTGPSSVGHVLGIYAGSNTLPIVENVTLINPKIDGGQLGWNIGTDFGDNGIAGTRCRHVRVYGGQVKNCYEGGLRHFGTGGNAVQFEAGVDDVLVTGLTARNCTNVLATQGLTNAAAPLDYRTSTGVKYADIKAYDCERIIGLFQAISPPSADVRVLSISIDGVQAYRCGKGRTGTGSDTSLPTDMGAINLDRAVNYSIKNVNIYNDGEYGVIDSVVRTIRSEAGEIQVSLYGSATNLVKHVVPVAGAGFAFSGNLRRNIYDITCYGVVTNPLSINRTHTSGTLVDQVYRLRSAILGTPFVVLDTGTLGGTNVGMFFEFGTGKTVEGQLEQIRTAGNSFPTQVESFQGTRRVNSLVFSYGTGTGSIIADGQLDVFTNASVSSVLRASFTSTGVTMVLPQFDSNAAAASGGVPVNGLYRHSDGRCLIRF